MVAQRKTLVKSFTVMILLILVVGQGILYTWLLLYQKSHLENSLRTDMTAIARFAADLFLVREGDQQSVERLLDAYLKTGNILSVEITSHDGITLTARAAGTAGGDNMERNVLDALGLFTIPAVNSVRVPLRLGVGDPGSVNVVYSGRPVNDVMTRFLVIPPVMQSITFLVVISAIILFFRRKVSSPVASINMALNRITEGDLVAAVPDMGDDEIGSIARGTRFLAEKLSATIARINALSNDVVTALGRLTVALDAAQGSTQKQAAAIDAVIASIKAANERQRMSAEDTDELSRVSHDNVSSLIEMKSTAEEIAASTQRLFRSTEDSYVEIAKVSQASKVVADSSSEVFRALEDTAASTEEINTSLRSVRESARRSSELSVHVRQLLTERGTLAVADAVEAMEKIAEDVENFAQIVSRLNERSKDIEKILSVLADVTDKTNLLSLNAAILADQAGEHGKGFAVVAGEIRALSDGSTASAKDIASIVRTIQSEIGEAVNAIRGGVRKVEEGKVLIERSGTAMGETLEAAQESARMASVVEKATNEQAAGLQQIRKSMENVRALFDQVAQGVEEEREGSARILDSIGEVKQVAELVQRGTGEHAVGTKVISKNLEVSLDMVSRIHQAAEDQLKVNEHIVDAVEEIRKAGSAAMKDMKEMVRSFEMLKSEVENLKGEMAVFKTRTASGTEMEKRSYAE